MTQSSEPSEPKVMKPQIALETLRKVRLPQDTQQLGFFLGMMRREREELLFMLVTRLTAKVAQLERQIEALRPKPQLIIPPLGPKSSGNAH